MCKLNLARCPDVEGVAVLPGSQLQSQEDRSVAGGWKHPRVPMVCMGVVPAPSWWHWAAQPPESRTSTSQRDVTMTPGTGVSPCLPDSQWGQCVCKCMTWPRWDHDSERP